MGVGPLSHTTLDHGEARRLGVRDMPLSAQP